MRFPQSYSLAKVIIYDGIVMNVLVFSWKNEFRTEIEPSNTQLCIDPDFLA